MSLTVLWQDSRDPPTPEELRALAEAVERARDEGRRVRIPTPRGDAYGYPSHSGQIACGINGGGNGFCILQGRG
jgi:hypothetical protein